MLVYSLSPSAVRAAAPRLAFGLPTRARAALGALLAAALAAAAFPAPAAAQYFGRNKVQYETFDFRILHTQHFDINYYPAESLAAFDAGRMADRWFARYQDVLNHRFDRRTVVLYADQPDFQQTNVIGGMIDQGTGGVTEPLRSRVVMPLTGVYADNDHVLGHELVHVFQFDIANSMGGAGTRGMAQLPLWTIEGMAEYMSVGREDPLTAMWLRDAALRNDIPSIRKLSTDPRYFPYRYGQALWAYIGGRWGDRAVVDVYRAALTAGWEPAIRRVLGVSADSLSREWASAIRAAYVPAMQGRARPAEAGDRLVIREEEPGEMNLAPAVSPDGRHVAFFGQRNLFTVELYVADANTGKIVGHFGGPNSNLHFDALSFINSAGAWSPDGRKFAFVVFAQGDNEIDVWDVGSRRIERRIKLRGVGALTDPAWSPDGKQLAVSGTTGGISDLYLMDLKTERVRQLTSGKEAELQPSWSPDGRTIAFATDRGEGTDFQLLTYAPMRLATIDVATGAITLLPTLGRVKHINPQYSPDGRNLYFVSDLGGFSDVYRLTLATGEFRQVTRLATGVSGLTALSPALSVARQTGRLVFSVFDHSGYGIVSLDSARAQGTPVTPATSAAVAVAAAPGAPPAMPVPAAPTAPTTAAAPTTPAAPTAAGAADGQTPPPSIAGILPPASALPQSRVAAYLSDPRTGLAVNPDYRQSDYRPSLSLDYVGAQAAGIAVSSFGTQIGGGVSLNFSDELGNRNVGGIIQASGTIKDIGAQVYYQNSRRRWNWGVAASHIPYLVGVNSFVTPTTVPIAGGETPANEITQAVSRVFDDELMGIVAYPLSTTRRLEASIGATRLGYDLELQNVVVLPDGQVVSDKTENGPTPSSLTYGSVGAALVGDYSFFGFTSPVAGGRYRFEATPTFGQLTMTSLLGDYRRYFLMRPLTFAVRGLFYGRYGRDAEDSTRLSPLFVGFENFMHGYSPESFNANECTAAANLGANGCPAFDRLIGSRLAVANFELRMPLFGTKEYGLINLPFLPTEIAPFFDAGVAWTSNSPPVWRFERATADRVPVFSTGVTARFNVFGYMVVEAYYAYPFQRPAKGGLFGFQIAPGW